VIWDRETGEAVEVELYVAVLGASNYTYVEATRTQQLADFVMSTAVAPLRRAQVVRNGCPDPSGTAAQVDSQGGDGLSWWTW